MRTPAHGACSAAVPAAGSGGVPPREYARSETLHEPAGADARATDPRYHPAWRCPRTIVILRGFGLRQSGTLARWPGVYSGSLRPVGKKHFVTAHQRFIAHRFHQCTAQFYQLTGPLRSGLDWLVTVNRVNASKL